MQSSFQTNLAHVQVLEMFENISKKVTDYAGEVGSFWIQKFQEQNYYKNIYNNIPKYLFSLIYF